MEKWSFQPLSIGLTGGIGSGKSTVLQQLQSYHMPIICADQIAHELTAPYGQALPMIEQVFGVQAIKEGGLDRDYMRHLIFQDNSAKLRLESILHPLIHSRMLSLYQTYQANYVVFDIPLLVESWQRYQTVIDRVCVVECDRATQIQRVLQRNCWDRSAIEKIIDQQATPEQRSRIAHDYINNGAHMSMSGLQQQVEQLHHQWLRLAQRRTGS